MPTKPKKPCRHPGCPELTLDTYCEKHNKLHNRPSAHDRGYDCRWRRLSKLYLQSHPLCIECNRQGRLVEATAVDHIVPHRGDPKLLWDQRNWQPLCKKCHNTKTGMQDSIPKYRYNKTK